ncbi:hypothetical protein JZ751_004334 [Albula glossodonta]|uniref:Ig-like domain-containing protein n=1 Tax=Albula glossodonta TaxID=121402 RepID=A0A8T2ND99_9TELE|nr:hypothetical protein JZ751_004334 [Albula glossodonta]
MQWVAPVTEARATKTKWDSVDILNQYTKGYLERECVEWLDKFLSYSEAQLRQASPPEVTIFARKSPQPDSRSLVCFAAEFYPKDIEMVILQNDVPLTESNGVTSSGVRPNGDGTLQLMKTLTIRASDMSNYSCLVQHRSLEQPIKKDLDGTCYDCDNDGKFSYDKEGIGMTTGLVIAVIPIVAILMLVCYFQRHIRETMCERWGSRGRSHSVRYKIKIPSCK